jgi:hypothetical protein
VNANSASSALAHSIRHYLGALPDDAEPITYQALAVALAVPPPHTIHTLVLALEQTMREDANSGRPFIAARVISRHRGGLPAPGFFALATALDRHDGAESGTSAQRFHAAQRAELAAWLAADSKQQ